jgi:hypothetical protein
MAFSENYKELLMIFSCFYRKYAHKHKKNAANNSRIIFFALYLQCSPAQFLNLTIMETGVGFIITLDYDKFREIFQKSRERSRKEKQKENNKAVEFK